MSERLHDSSFSGRNIDVNALEFNPIDSKLFLDDVKFSADMRKRRELRALQIAANEAYDAREGHLNPSWIDERIDLEDRHYEQAEREILSSIDALQTSEPSVFISYKTEDVEWVTKLTAGLHSHGVSSFLAAQSIRGGDIWLNKITDALRRCRTCVFFATPNSINDKKNNWCKLEVGAAISLQKKLLTVRLMVEEKDLFDPLGLLQQFDLSGPNRLDDLTEEVVRLAREPVS